MKTVPFASTSTIVEIPESLENIDFKGSENIKGTKPAYFSVTGRSNCSASSYPYPLPPKVGIERAPVATIKELQLISKNLSEPFIPDSPFIEKRYPVFLEVETFLTSVSVRIFTPTDSHSRNNISKILLEEPVQKY